MKRKNNLIKMILVLGIILILLNPSFLVALENEEKNKKIKQLEEIEKEADKLNEKMDEILSMVKKSEPGKEKEEKKEEQKKPSCDQLGGLEVEDKREEVEKKCAKPLEIFYKEKGVICCKPKEPIREIPKKPGRLGRLESCLTGRYWLWDKGDESKFLEKAESAIKDALIILADKGITLTITMSKLEELKKSIKTLPLQEKSKKIDEVRDEIYEKVTKPLGEELAKARSGDDKDKIKAIEDAQKKVEEAEQNLEKARAIYAMTISEGVANALACYLGMAKASQLAFGNYGGLAGGAVLGLALGVAHGGGLWSFVVPGGGFLVGYLPFIKNPSNPDIEMGSCQAETPLKGVNPEEVCKKCNEDPLRVCTYERCTILGNCIAVPTAKGDQYVCIAGKCEELGLPLFTYVNVSWFIDGQLNGSTIQQDNRGKEINIALNNNKTIPFNTKLILINLTTDKPAQCRWILDKKNANFSEMQDFEDNYFPTLPDGSADYQYAHILLPGDLSRDPGVVHRIFIKCKNVCGVEPKASYDQNVISFKFEKKPDQLPPQIVYVDPASGSVVRGDLAFVNVSFWLDEKGFCKFSDKSTNFTTNYDKMVPFGKYNNENSSIIDGTCKDVKCLDRNETCSMCEVMLNMSRGYEIINYSGTEFNETKFYYFIVRCNDTAGNVMSEDDIFEYKLMTAPPYTINITKPEKNEKTYERQPEIEVTSEPRMTECRYRIFEYARAGAKCDANFPKWTDMWPIDVGLSTIHKGKHNETLNASSAGVKHLLCVKCRDYWNIEVIDQLDFFVLLDPFSPEVIRMYHDTTMNDLLIIETNEEAECVYTHKNCNYNFTEGSPMMSTDKFLHAAYWQLEPYYIKCKDKWDNYPGAKPDANACTIVIYPYELPVFG